VDSDFDIDENEEQEGETQNQNELDDESKPKRQSSKRGVFTKAYKEPQVKKESVRNEESKRKTHLQDQQQQEQAVLSNENKTFRSSTALKRKELEERQKEREAKSKTSKKASSSTMTLDEFKRLTQEELLAEAKITEKINLASLDAYQKLELEKKKKAIVKQVSKVPLIRFHSVSMPVVSHDDDIDEENKNLAEIKKQCRNFVSFSDENVFKETFPQQKSKPNVHKKCVVTGLPAKYFDPVTQCPYANLYAFKALRDMHSSKKI
jgi:vacuolar protein sorting-associated protein 72